MKTPEFYGTFLAQTRQQTLLDVPREWADAIAARPSWVWSRTAEGKVLTISSQAGPNFIQEVPVQVNHLGIALPVPRGLWIDRVREVRLVGLGEAGIDCPDDATLRRRR